MIGSCAVVMVGPLSVVVRDLDIVRAANPAMNPGTKGAAAVSVIPGVGITAPRQCEFGPRRPLATGMGRPPAVTGHPLTSARPNGTITAE